MGDRYSGERTYLRIVKETTWGTVPGSPTWLNIPGRGDDFYSVAEVPARTVIQTNVGAGRNWKDVYGLPTVQGSLRTFAFPATAKEMIEWATKLTANDLASYSAQYFDVNEFPQHVGLKVRRFVMSSGAQPTAQPVTFDFDLVGKSETLESTFSEGAYDEDRPYKHSSAVITVDSAANAEVEQYTITVDNVIDVGSGTGTAIQWAQWVGRVITGSLTLAYKEPGLRTKFKNGTAIDFKTVISHEKGAAYDLTVDLKTNVKITRFQPQRTLRGIVRAQMDFESMLTAAGGDDFSVDVS